MITRLQAKKQMMQCGSQMEEESADSNAHSNSTQQIQEPSFINHHDIPLQNTGKLEDQLFINSISFQHPNGLNVEGLSYSEIEADQKLGNYLNQLKGNLPGYFNLSARQKAHYFKKMERNFLDQMNSPGKICENNSDRIFGEEQNKRKNIENSDGKQKKRVTFSKKQFFVAFDKDKTPHEVSNLDEMQRRVKF